MMSFSIANSILQWSAILLNLLLTIALLRQFNQLSDSIAEFSGMESGLETGSRAPDFEAETLTGETLTLADYMGKVVSFIFVSTHCDACIDKFPALNAFADKAKQAGVEVVLVNTDDDKGTIAGLVQKHGVSLPVLVAPIESNPFARNYRAEAVPSYCLLNPDSYIESAGLLGPKWEKQITQAWTTV
ncbi:peroxiredoxin family protein [Thermocoleostomius sinensis]|jgi:peroxiredoxin|uniref:TlpA disulfide reductase family protein n=1 Tax=Thermocoleostomius sinensis A174 TaxID=2016057 RepID=A0A9E9CAS4_9CYAN|nr:TlpA disulfide reductase family protein [Thermocoleostomius sinensis]WAL61367.1 TlpA disulfide reductase family protein [Thermocoleostomius sinensis A174]